MKRPAASQLLIRVSIVDLAPPIWRLIAVPEAFTLHRLHRVLQFVFSRLDYHLYEFRVGTGRYQAPDPESEGKDSTRTTLKSLRLGAGSSFTYLYDFGDYWEHTLTVESVLPMPPDGSGGWSPRLIDGARAAPPEDAGGVPGYEAFLTALSDRNHPEHQAMRDWAGKTYDPERFDPWALDHALALAVAWGAI